MLFAGGPENPCGTGAGHRIGPQCIGWAFPGDGCLRSSLPTYQVGGCN